jgi:thiamine pyrophosphokinase
MKCVIIANGDFEYKGAAKDAIDSAKLIVCADGGARHLKVLNIFPHALIGDFDSIKAEDKSFFETGQTIIISHPANKDKTDSDLCISWALQNNATDITLLGVTGNRMDHTLANVYLLVKLAGQGITARIINSHNEIYIVKDYLELNGLPGEYLSLVPVSEKVKGITLKGLKYTLNEAELEMGSSLGISNVFRSRETVGADCISTPHTMIEEKRQKTVASVYIREGMLLVIKSKD